jgi:hypothetical protein
VVDVAAVDVAAVDVAAVDVAAVDVAAVDVAAVDVAAVDVAAVGGPSGQLVCSACTLGSTGVLNVTAHAAQKNLTACAVDVDLSVLHAHCMARVPLAYSSLLTLRGSDLTAVPSFEDFAE